MASAAGRNTRFVVTEGQEARDRSRSMRTAWIGASTFRHLDIEHVGTPAQARRVIVKVVLSDPEDLAILEEAFG